MRAITASRAFATFASMGMPVGIASWAALLAGLSSLLVVGCSRNARTPETPAATRVDSAQGIAGTFEALGGARLADPGCDTLTVEARRDSCERHFLSQMTWPLQGLVTFHPQGGAVPGDSLTVTLDSAGGYRAPLPPGHYRVCVQAEGLEGHPNSCTDSVAVNPGVYTPFSRPFPMP